MFQRQSFHNERPLDCLLHGVGAIGLVIIGSIAYWMVAAPNRAPADSARMPSAHAGELRAVHAELFQLENELAAVEARIEEGSRRIPTEPRETEFLRDVVRIADEVNFTLRDYQPSQPKAQTGCPQVLIDVYGSGDYRSICRFLDEVGRLPRLATIERLDIAAEATDAVYPVSIQIGVYFTGQPAGGEHKGGGNHG